MDMEQFLMQFVTTPVELLAAVVGMLIVLELITLQKIKKMEKQNRMWKDGIEKRLQKMQTEETKLLEQMSEGETVKAAEQADLQKKKTPEGAAAQELLDEVLSEVFPEIYQNLTRGTAFAIIAIVTNP